ncbi:mitotic checkpoint serine/threonine-protein kinase BUB1-like isoform X2 [Dendronephthya gigantea]|uniref:mitotic checkpoint serine/threonine-protein kinase BUB1-like isoform X2 n=1 Tax=Dendronephthya gigantea TaxID=151771 RepID=UPI00106ACDCA|nr:mitotic checkpoint serine/threonine-protein kinase BUB1-like isoform X2 [Dendronephthya gigantea]
MDPREWELSKENVQPIKQGRKVPNLTAALTPCGLSDDSLYWGLQKDKQNFEAEIRTYEGDDFLDIWYRYILWTEENVPKGGREIGTLLERCIKEFQDVSRYQNDERYLDVWLKYADCCSDPLEIFNYLHASGACSQLALLYIAWASACENVENFQKADQVLSLGIERRAQPLEMLQKHHTGFQHRLNARIVASEDNQPGFGHGDQRKALGSLLTAGKKKMVGVLRTPASQNPVIAANPRSGGVKSEKRGLGFAVHHDSDDVENRISQLPEVCGNEWKEAPTQSLTSKENINMPGKWTGGKGPSRRAPSSTVPLTRAVPQPSFQIHVDENADQIGHVHQTVGSQVLSVRKSDSEVSNNPLKNTADSCAPNVKVMYDKSKVYTGAEEFQFEEIHAAKYMAVLKQGLPRRKDINKAKMEQNKKVKPEKNERVMYPKNKVYAYEGEFQPEELMARLYYERGNRLRIPKTKELQPSITHPTDLLCRSVQLDGVHPPEAEASNVTLRTVAKKSLPRLSEDFRVWDDNEAIPHRQLSAQVVSVPPENSREIGQSVSSFPIFHDNENIPPPPCNTRSTILSDKPKVHSSSLSEFQNIDAENIPPPPCGTRGDTLRNSKRVLNPPSLIPNIDAENIPPPPDTRGTTLPNRARNISASRMIVSTDVGASEDFPPQENCRLSSVSKNIPQATENIESFQAVPSTCIPGRESIPVPETTVDPGPRSRESFHAEESKKSERRILQTITPKLPRYKLDLAGEGYEKKENTDGQAKEISIYCDEDQENVPLFGYSQTKLERPILGILQPSEGIPFVPLEDLEEIDAEDERLDEVCSDRNPVSLTREETKFAEDETTRHNWENHSQFTAAARLASTPFSSNLSPPKLENLHCSRIQANDDETNVSKVTNPTSNSPYNANNSKGLSPILECSDEDAKTGSSKGSSSYLPGLSAQTTQPTIVSQANTMLQDGTTNLSEGPNKNMDITVHDMNGTFLKIINPFDPSLCNELLAQLHNPVTSFPGYHDFKKNVLPKFAMNKVVSIGSELFKIDSIAGTGAYAKVFSATKVDTTTSNTAEVALKVQRPANDWEFYICSEIVKRMRNRGKSQSEIASVMNATDHYSFADGSCAVANLHKRGTFLDFVNECKVQQSINERIAFFCAIGMMRILENIHDCGIIHGDFKPDNFVVLEDNVGSDEELCRLGLIDFGCAIDLKLFPPGTRFSVDKNTESFECIEMRTQRPWTTQVDTYGMLCSLHCLIFGDYMKVYQEKRTGRWKITKSFNRTWNRVLWNKLFDMFLNIPSCDDLPSLAAIRQEFQEYFESEEDDDLEQTCDVQKRYMNDL